MKLTPKKTPLTNKERAYLSLIGLVAWLVSALLTVLLVGTEVFTEVFGVGAFEALLIPIWMVKDNPLCSLSILLLILGPAYGFLVAYRFPRPLDLIATATAGLLGGAAYSLLAYAFAVVIATA